MRKLLFFWLIAIPVLAQTPAPIQENFSIFRGNVYESKPLALQPVDTLQTISVRYTYTNAPGSLLIDPQPIVSRTGLTVVLRFTSTAALPETGWYELSAGVGKAKFAGVVSVGKNGTVVTSSDGTLLATYLSQVAVLQGTLATKLNKSDTTGMLQPYAKAVSVYPKSQTYSKVESDTNKPDFDTVSNISEAQAQVETGKPKLFLITNDTPYGGSSLTLWNGSSFSVMPLIPRTN
jgi:hypothetical protein